MRIVGRESFDTNSAGDLSTFDVTAVRFSPLDINREPPGRTSISRTPAMIRVRGDF